MKVKVTQGTHRSSPLSKYPWVLEQKQSHSWVCLLPTEEQRALVFRSLLPATLQGLHLLLCYIGRSF